MIVPSHEATARHIRTSIGTTQTSITWLWRNMIERIGPTLAVDAGANYGEIGFCARYPRNCRVLLVEANPILLAYLGRSAALHRNRRASSVIHALISDRAGVEAFFVDTRWSAISAAGLGERGLTDGAPLKRIDLPARTLDEIVSAHVPTGAPNGLIFKLDLEGYEPKALRGFTKTLASTRFAGIVEFSAQFVRRSGETPGKALELFRTFGEVRLLDAGGRLVSLPQGVAWITEDLHCDLVIASSTTLIASLAPTAKVSAFLCWASGPWARGAEPPARPLEHTQGRSWTKGALAQP